MDGDRHLEMVVRDVARMVDAMGRAPTAPVRRYPGWTLVDLARHVATVHAWVAEVVATRADQRPPHPDLSGLEAATLPTQLLSGAEHLVDVLGTTDVDEPVWTLDASDRTAGFWRRRMAIETALHRWDAQDAVGTPEEVPGWLTLQAVDEAVRVYLGERLEGREVAGGGERIRLDAGDHHWMLRLRPDGVDVTEDDENGAAATLAATAMDLWLLVTGRRSLDDVRVAGDRQAAETLVRAAALSPGPGNR